MFGAFFLKASVILLIFTNLAKASCPCRLTTFDLLSCYSTYISNFPKDYMDGCSARHPANEIAGLDLDYQQITELKGDSFFQFEELVTLSVSKNGLETIRNKAFDGLAKLKLLVMRHNNIWLIEPGALDSLVGAKKIILNGNQFLNNITTRSWTFCHQIKSGTLTIEPEDLKIVADLSLHSAFEEDYCATKQIQETPTVSRCRPDEDSLDCSSLRSNDIHALSCQLKYQDTFEYKSITIDFPIDNQIKPVIPDFSQEFDFFKNLATNEELNRNKANITIRTVVFDIADLEKNTDDKTTKEVWIWADVVFISRPITITYQLRIVAREVIIDQNLSMRLPWSKLKNQHYVTQLEKHYTFQETLVRHRQYGLLEIIDKVPSLSNSNSQSCQPQLVSATAQNTDESWFDETFASMMYLYTFSLLDAEGTETKATAVKIATHFYNFYYDKDIVKNDRAFKAANRLSRVQLIRAEEGVINNVPYLTLDATKDLASTMHRKLSDYRVTERQQEVQLEHLEERLQDMQVHFSNIDLQFQNYMRTEKQQLETFFAENSASASFDFDHRHNARQSISSQLEANIQATNSMANIEMNLLQTQTDNSVAHSNDVILKFEQEIARHQSKSNAEADTIRQFHDEFKNALYKLWIESERFQENLENYKISESTKIAAKIAIEVGRIAANTVKIAEGGNPFKIVFGSGVGDAAEAAVEIANSVMEIGLAIEQMADVNALVAPDRVNYEKLQGLITDPSPEFKTALKESTKLKRHGSMFHDLKVTAMIKLDHQNQETGQGISGIDDLMSAYSTLSNAGDRLIMATGEYADTTLELVNKKGDLRLAQNDLQRAKSSVHAIEKAKEKTSEMAEEFNGKILDIKDEYEDQSRDLISEYQNAASGRKHEIKNQIHQRYQAMNNALTLLRTNYFASLNEMVDALYEKKYGLKLASITYRSMMSVLFNGYCQGLFYNTFRKCNKRDKPSLGDGMETLLSKLLALQWGSIENQNAISPLPQGFTYPNILIQDKPNLHPIYNLKKENETTINFKDWIPAEKFEQRWRFRVKQMEVFLLDSNDAIITRDDNREITIQIIYPMLFEDTDKFGNAHTFLAQPFYCVSSYTSHSLLNSIEMTTSHCKVEKEFSNFNYKPSPNGDFNLKILTIDDLDFDSIAKLKISLKGSFVHIPQIG